MEVVSSKYLHIFNCPIVSILSALHFFTVYYDLVIELGEKTSLHQFHITQRLTFLS